MRLSGVPAKYPHGIIALVGLPGSGKTAAALAWAVGAVVVVVDGAFFSSSDLARVKWVLPRTVVVDGVASSVQLIARRCAGAAVAQVVADGVIRSVLGTDRLQAANTPARLRKQEETSARELM